jgi:phosphoribosyl 1,2-cyclic phosphodiesterase
MPDELRVKFWGVRGSYPAPGAGTVKYGGNTACVEIRAGARTILLDAGTGIIPLGHELARQRVSEMLLLFSHLHHDHTQGFPFFVPAYLPNVRLHIFGPGATPETLRRVLERNQSPEAFPLSLRDMASVKEIQPVRESQIIVWDEAGVRLTESADGAGEGAVVIRTHKSYAHPGGVHLYRVTWRGRSIVYATDTEGYVGTDRRLVEFAKEADVLIHDAQYSEEHYTSKQGYGHSTGAMACEVAAAARVGTLVLLHHDPAYADDVVASLEASAHERFARASAAYEGMEIDLPIHHSPAIQKDRPGDVQYASHD